MLRGGHRQCFGGGVDVKPSLTALRAGGNNGETDAVAGDRGAISDGGLVVLAGDPHAMQLALRHRLEARDLADIGDYAREHLSALVDRKSVFSERLASTNVEYRRPRDS